QAGLLYISMLSSSTAWAEEPSGFLGQVWGTRWDDVAIASLAGCEGQGTTVGDVDGYVALVLQPECVGYRFSDELTVNLILIFPDVKWHAIEQSRLVVDNLLAFRKMWGLDQQTVGYLERWSRVLDRRLRQRSLYGAQRPVVSDMAYGTLDLPEAA